MAARSLVNKVTGHWQVETVARVYCHLEVVQGTKCREEKLRGSSATTPGEAQQAALRHSVCLHTSCAGLSVPYLCAYDLVRRVNHHAKMEAVPSCYMVPKCVLI